MHYFSRATGGFYEDSIHGEEMPADALLLTPEQYRAVMTDAPAGTYIAVGQDGYPLRLNCQPPDLELCERVWRDEVIDRVHWLRDRHRDELELGDPPTLSTVHYQSLLLYLKALRDWPQADAFPDTAQRPVEPSWIAAHMRFHPL